jgi:hypothetical protein
LRCTRSARKLAARNIGGAHALGTTGALDPANGYMIDVVLSKDMSVPPGFATFSQGFLEDARSNHNKSKSCGARYYVETNDIIYGERNSEL